HRLSASALGWRPPPVSWKNQEAESSARKEISPDFQFSIGPVKPCVSRRAGCKSRTVFRWCRIQRDALLTRIPAQFETKASFWPASEMLHNGAVCEGHEVSRVEY